MNDAHIGALLSAAAQRYKSSGRTVMYSVLGKLRTDPLFVEVLRQGLLRNASSLLDLGCGRAVLFAVLIEARECYEHGQWPTEWPIPPTLRRMQGIDLSERDVDIANRALAPHVDVRRGDLSQVDIQETSFITLFDVLHYLDTPEQERLLLRIAAALEPDGTLLIRVGDAGARWRHAFTQFIDRTVWALRGNTSETLHCRGISEWIALLHRTGFSVNAMPMDRGTPFSNVLLTARRIRT